MLRVFLFVVLLAALLAASCAQSPDSDRKKELSERERDSLIGASEVLPGSRVVKRALEVSDTAAAQAARQDSAHY